VGFLGGRILLFDALDYRITIQESRDSIYFRPRPSSQLALCKGKHGIQKIGA